VFATPPGSENAACTYRGSSGSSGDPILSWLTNSGNRYAGKRNVPGSRGCFAEAMRKPVTGDTNKSAKNIRYWGPIARVKKPKKQSGSLSGS